MDKVIISHYNTPCGLLTLGSFHDKLCICDWQVGRHSEIVNNRLIRALNVRLIYDSSDIIEMAKFQLNEYFNKSRKIFSVPLLYVGTDFQNKVWRQLLTIPYGSTISYIDLAKSIGSPKSVRAVANANGANALSIFVPCHRVIGHNGQLIGYAGGLDAKKFLLDLEMS